MPGTDEPVAGAALPEQAVMAVSNSSGGVDAPHKATATSEQLEAAQRVPRNITLTPEALSNTPLEGPYPSEDTLMSQALWVHKPVAVLVARRLGCALCRDFARNLAERRKEFERSQCDIVVIADQKLYAQDFVETVWPLPLYFDLGGRFKSTLGGNVIAFTKLPKGGGAEDINEHGMIRGGELVVANYGVFLQTTETVAFGHCSVERILQACRMARGI